MKWPWQWHHCTPAPVSGDVDEAREARERAEADLSKTRARRPEVEELAAKLRAAREKNHFAEQIEESFRKRGTE